MERPVMWPSGDFRVTLIGSGTPVPNIERFAACTLVEAGGRTLLIDAGRGATMRLRQLDIPLSWVDPLLITHYHSDHVAGLPDLWLTGWLPGAGGGRKTPFRVIAPRGARSLMDGLADAYSLDIRTRLADEKLPPEGIKTVVEEFDRDGIVYEEGGVRVTAFEVDHGDAIKPACGYRFDYGGHSAVVSGDTRYSENLIRHAHGADLLVHEVCHAQDPLLEEPIMRRVVAHHTSPRDAGRVFAQVRPKLAAYTHIVLLGNSTVPPPTLDDVVNQTRYTYDGPLVVGEDLMSFEIGSEIKVHRFDGRRAAVGRPLPR